MIIFLLFSCSSFAVTVGSQAPNFSTVNQDGKPVHLTDFSGHDILLYFYPKDDTPGCTKEACQFRDQFVEFKQKGAVVLGVSRQDVKSHKNFRDKHHIPFDLLVDADGTIASAYGVGKYPVLGFLKRQSVLIGKKGEVLKVYEDVDPDKHASQVLKDLQQLEK